MRYTLFTVEQGNGNGQSIDKNSDSLLRTSDLIGCIAVIIIGETKCSLVHSDSNYMGGIGCISLAHGIKLLNIKMNEYYEIILAGGSSLISLNNKYKEIKKILVNSNVRYAAFDIDTVYLDSTGIVAYSKSSLAQQLGVDIDDLELDEPNYLMSM